MRFAPLALAAALVAGCAGHVADHIGPKETIVAPQLDRYGLASKEAQCVAGILAARLTPKQLRLFARRAGGVERGWFEPGRLTPRDLSHVAGHSPDPAVGRELAAAYQACGVDRQVIAEIETRMAGADEESLRLQPSGNLTGVRRVTSPTTIWLNLGAAPTGQAIAVDASTIEGEAASRTGWFRLTDPGANGPDPVSYRLEVDCAARTIQPLAHRRQDAAGAVAEEKSYAPGEEKPLAVEGGTVMEIAFLALCT